ncbi:hypothetical protein [Sphingosinicella sp. BN140058]|uniref:hypothetical protein n=1 Tax=Sphingosinicella sp. BN140058 TaxID=1892855 RepID=UPI001012F35F|nr:hypothetical protein [Sphingosinicella sp. BN140058]QAY80399.1 hypothetical protein ETR14_27550 [Sphingosinicella sp. BN140058]
MVSDKVWNAAKAKADAEVPPPLPEPIWAGIQTGIICVSTIAVFIALRWVAPLEVAWCGTAAAGAAVAWFEARDKAKRHSKAMAHWVNLYRDDPRL